MFKNPIFLSIPILNVLNFMNVKKPENIFLKYSIKKCHGNYTFCAGYNIDTSYLLISSH
jgi:hypothetical protein